MTKVQIRSEKLTPFGGIFSIMEQFESKLSPVIDSTLGRRCGGAVRYKFSEIVRSLMSVFKPDKILVSDSMIVVFKHFTTPAITFKD